MKTYFFIAIIAFALVLTSCSADSDDTIYAKPEQVQQFDSFNMIARDSLDSEGNPIKPKGKD